MLNPYFSNTYFHQPLQNLLNTFCIAAIQQKGSNFEFLPRSTINFDQVLGEGEHYEFNTEISKLMKMIIHNFYSSKDVFLRELISNASDAIDKAKFNIINDKSYLFKQPTKDIDV